MLERSGFGRRVRSLMTKSDAFLNRSAVRLAYKTIKKVLLTGSIELTSFLIDSAC